MTLYNTVDRAGSMFVLASSKQKRYKFSLNHMVPLEWAAIGRRSGKKTKRKKKKQNWKDERKYQSKSINFLCNSQNFAKF